MLRVIGVERSNVAGQLLLCGLGDILSFEHHLADRDPCLLREKQGRPLRGILRAAVVDDRQPRRMSVRGNFWLSAGGKPR